MNCLLDTSAFSALLRRERGHRARLAVLVPTTRIVLCTITRGEVLYGLSRLPRGRRRTVLTEKAIRLFDQFPCVPIAEGAGDEYARLKRQAERSGTPLDENDLWIAATALHLGAVLVSTDGDFERLTGLQVEDWSA